MSESLEQKVQDLTERLKRLEDHIQITQLVAQYGPAVDSGSLTAAPQLWESDGVYDVINYRRMEGRADIQDMLTGPGHQSAIMDGCGHVNTVPHVVVDGDEATGRNYQMMVRWNPELQQFFVFRLSACKWHWRRTPEGWRIVNRTNRLMDGAEAARALMAASPDQT